MLGLFSYFMDGVGGGEAQAAAVPAGGPGSSGSSGSRRRRSREQEEQLQRWQQRRSALDLLLSPAMPLLAAVAPCAFAAEQSAGGGCGVPRGRQ